MSDLISRQALIAKAYEEAKGMAEPYEDFGILVDWLASKIPSQSAGISESTRQAILNVLDDFADETMEIHHGAYEKARYAMCRLLEG